MRAILFYTKVWCNLICVLFTVECSYSQNGVIKGKIISGQEVLAAATVYVGKKIVLSDANGEFSLSLPTGNHILIVSHAGYRKLEEAIAINENETKAITIHMVPDDQMNEIVVLGSRLYKKRTNFNMPVPIDVFTSEKLVYTGQHGLVQMLNFSAPSFNASRQLTNEPITLRGLDPDHLLILVNGRRFSGMAWLYAGNLRGMLGKGSVGNDLHAIPFSAIEKVEILRDGASSQYGSDAIAGVINIHLKKSVGKTSLNLHTGRFYEGDGQKISLGINHGVSLNNKGFLNFSSDFRFQAPTFREGKYQGTVYYDLTKVPSSQRNAVLALDSQRIIDRGFNRRAAASNVGITKLFSYGILVNGGYPIANDIELIWTVLLNYRKNLLDGAYRFPKTTNQVNAALFPNGFKALITPNTWDISTTVGAKGQSKKGWHWELTKGFGHNSSINNVSNTNNASQIALGKEASTNFYLGTLGFTQHSWNLSFTRDFTKNIKGVKSFNIGSGAEWRLENYRIKEGEEPSWENYDSSGKTQGGSQGQGGFSPENAINKNRNITALYLDVESDLTNRLLINLSGRYEQYNDFGGNLAGKLAARYKITPSFLLRGSASNGFRAPSLQQRYFSTTSSRWSSTGNGNIPVIRGLFRNDSEMANAFKVPSLSGEKSVNLSGGFSSKFSKHFSFTGDVYFIEIRNRVVLSGTFDSTNSDAKQILAGYPGIDQVQFFANAINTRTRGVDMLLNGNWIIQKARIELTLAANFTRTRIFGKIRATDKLPGSNIQNANTLFNSEEKEKLERGQPGSKIILSATIIKDKFRFEFRNTRFGKTSSTTLVQMPADTLYEFFSQKILTDLAISYTPKQAVTITAGVNNIFNVYPDRLTNYRNTVDGSLLYSNEASPFGYNGGYYFINMAFRF